MVCNSCGKNQSKKKFYARDKNGVPDRRLPLTKTCYWCRKKSRKRDRTIRAEDKIGEKQKQFLNTLNYDGPKITSRKEATEKMRELLKEIPNVNVDKSIQKYVIIKQVDPSTMEW